MAYGASNTNPVQPCAYLKYTAGWASRVFLTTPQIGVSVSSTYNQIYKYEHPTQSNEYYLIENRQQTGRDSPLPDDGLAIWHIDTNGNNDHQQQTPELHYEVTLVQADGDWDLENDRNMGDTTDLYGAPTYTDCTPSTDPNTNWWDGSGSGLSVTNISSSAATMTFDFNAEDCNGNGIADDQDNEIPDECEIDLTEIFVLWDYDGCENGRWSFPFDTVGEGVARVTDHGNVYIMAGNYPETLTINRPMTLNAPSGTVVIGE